MVSKKVKILTIIGVIVAAYVGYELYKMSKVDYYKTLLQTELNRQYQRSGTGSFCYVAGEAKLPYIENGYPAKYRKNKNLNYLHQSLPVYYKLDLLTRQQVEGTDYYQYKVSEEGQKYRFKSDKVLAFCFGFQKVIEITHVDIHDSMTSRGEKEIVIDYEYQIDDIPNWAIDKDFLNLYRYNVDEEITKEFFKNGSSRQTFIEKKNGDLYIDGGFFNYYWAYPLFDESLGEE